jgi:hypothetical protein
MIPDAIEVRLTPKERAELEGRLRAGTTEQRQLLRMRIVLEAAEGHTPTFSAISLFLSPLAAASTMRARSAIVWGARCLRVSAVNSRFSSSSSTIAAALPRAILAPVSKVARM